MVLPSGTMLNDDDNPRPLGVAAGILSVAEPTTPPEAATSDGEELPAGFQNQRPQAVRIDSPAAGAATSSSSAHAAATPADLDLDCGNFNTTQQAQVMGLRVFKMETPRPLKEADASPKGVEASALPIKHEGNDMPMPEFGKLGAVSGISIFVFGPGQHYLNVILSMVPSKTMSQCFISFA